MDKYKRLATNTLIFAIAAFSSKVLVFLMMPFYTRALGTEGYGIVELLIPYCNILVPVASIGIINAIIRFGLEEKYDRQSVFTIGLITLAAGFVIVLLFDPLIAKIESISQYRHYLYLLTFMSCLHGLLSQFARSIGYVKYYAIDGVIATAATIVLNIILIVFLKMDVNGYLLATIGADLICSVLCVLILRLYRYFNIKKIVSSLYKKMLAYCIPLIPNTICTWLINLSNKQTITSFYGAEVNGIFSAANKIPTIILTVANIFSEAWQISAVTEKDEREKFFSRISMTYQSFAFTLASGIILFSKVAVKILAGDEFYDAWHYIPILSIATVFGCLANFLASVYMVEKKSIYTFITIFVSTALNVLCAAYFIPKFGIYGACIAISVCYVVMFVSRAVHTRKYLKIDWNIKRFLFNTAAVIAEAAIMISEIKIVTEFDSYIVCGFICFAVVLINIKEVLTMLKNKIKK